MRSDDSGSSLGSDFAVMDAEYSIDSDGPKNGQAGDTVSNDTAKNVEERRRQKRLAKLDKKIKQATKRQQKEKPIKLE